MPPLTPSLIFPFALRGQELVFLLFAFEGAVTSQVSALKDTNSQKVLCIAAGTLVSERTIEGSCDLGVAVFFEEGGLCLLARVSQL